MSYTLIHSPKSTKVRFFAPRIVDDEAECNNKNSTIFSSGFPILSTALNRVSASSTVWEQPVGGRLRYGSFPLTDPYQTFFSTTFI